MKLHGPDSVAIATEMQGPNARAAFATVRSMGFRIDDELNEARAKALERLIALVFAGNNAAIGRRLGYRDGSFIGQMLRREKAITEVTWQKLAELHEVRQFLRQGNSISPILLIDGSTGVSHEVSHPEPIITLRSVTWEGLKVDRFEEPFQMAIETDDLMPDVARGEIARFKPGAAPRAGKAVLLKDSHGDFHLRLFEPGLGGDWAGYSKQPGVKRLERFKDGMELIAPMTGHDWA